MRNTFSLLRFVEEPEDLAVPVIDGMPLFERVLERYPGVAIGRVLPPSLHWLGTPAYGERGKAVILDGSCGYAACCGVIATIEIRPTTVRWYDFDARGSPQLPKGLRFEFDRDQYLAALQSLANAARLEWDDDPDRRPT